MLRARTASALGNLKPNRPENLKFVSDLPRRYPALWMKPVVLFQYVDGSLTVENPVEKVNSDWCSLHRESYLLISCQSKKHPSNFYENSIRNHLSSQYPGKYCMCHYLMDGNLSIFYRYFHRHCSQEMREIIPVPLRHVRTTRCSTHSHPFQVSLPTSRTLSHKSSIIPRTCNLWKVLPSSCFPEPYYLPSFKSKINKLDLISLSS